MSRMFLAPHRAPYLPVEAFMFRGPSPLTGAHARSVWNAVQAWCWGALTLRPGSRGPSEGGSSPPFWTGL